MGEKNCFSKEAAHDFHEMKINLKLLYSGEAYHRIDKSVGSMLEN